MVGIEAPADNYYELGDVMYDFTLTVYDFKYDESGNRSIVAKEVTLYDLLEDYNDELDHLAWYLEESVKKLVEIDRSIKKKR